MNSFRFEEIKIGQEVSFNHCFNKNDISKFSDLTGDFNPLHVDDDYAKNTEYGGVIVHGMLVASLFSTLVGMYLPGKYCLYLSQDIQFRKPVRPKDELSVRGKVTNKIDTLNILEIETMIFNQKKEKVVSGMARVRVIK